MQLFFSLISSCIWMSVTGKPEKPVKTDNHYNVEDRTAGLLDDVSRVLLDDQLNWHTFRRSYISRIERLMVIQLHFILINLIRVALIPTSKNQST